MDSSPPSPSSSTTSDGSVSIGRDVHGNVTIINTVSASPLPPGSPGVVSTPAPLPPFPGTSPYKGLAYFDEHDTHKFFGREALTAELLKRLLAQPAAQCLAIVGASGSGKSSLLRAGLIPPLRQQGLVCVLTPTAKPLESLALALETDDATAIKLMDNLRTEPRALHFHARRRISGNGRLFLVVDQFEELFTLCKDPAERAAFVAALLTAIAPETAGPTTLVFALRADFYGFCEPYPALRATLEAHQKFIGPLAAPDLRRAIEQPALAGGWELEEGLVDELLRDVGALRAAGAEPGALPLLAHALHATWEQRSDKRLTLQGYNSIGGVAHAIANTANAVLDQLDEADKARAQRIFLALTEVAEHNDIPDTRRIATLADLAPHENAERLAVQKVLETLAQARLIIMDSVNASSQWQPPPSPQAQPAPAPQGLARTEEGLQPAPPPAHITLQVAHEALIREWPALRTWLTETRDRLRQQRKLEEAAKEWVALGRSSDVLYRGLPLEQALYQFLGPRPEHPELVEGEGQLPPLALEFINASRAQAEHEAAERQAQQQRELQLAKDKAEAEQQRAEIQTRSSKQLRQRAHALTGAFISAVLLTGVAIFFWNQSNQNLQQANEKTQQNLALALRFQVIPVLVEFPQEFKSAALLAIESLQRYPSLDANQTLDKALVFMPDEIAQMAPGSDVNTVAFSPNGQWVATGSADGTAHVWDAVTGREVAHMPHEGVVTSVAFNPNSEWVASGSADGTVRVWETTTGQEVAHMLHEGEVTSVAFSPNGEWVASGSLDGTACVWVAAAGSEVACTTHADAVTSVAFDPNSQWVVSGSWDNTARVWASTTGEEVAHITHESAVNSVAFNPFDRLVVSGSADGTARVWDATSGREMYQMPNNGNVTVVAFSPDGEQVVYGSWDGSVQIWEIIRESEVDSWQAVAHMHHDNAVTSVDFSADGRWVISGSADGTARVWEVTTGREVARMTEAGYVQAVAFSPNGPWVVSGSSGYNSPTEPTIHVWEAVDWHEVSRIQHDGVAGVTDNILVAFNANNQWVASGSMDGIVRIWEAATGHEIVRMPSVEGFVTAIVFSPDGQWVASGDTDGIVHVWEATTGREVARMTHEDNDAAVTAIAFSPDGQWVASGDANGIARVWEIATEREVTHNTDDHAAVIALVFSPDGQQIVVGNNNGTIHVWDWEAANRRIAMTNWMHNGNYAAITALAFSPDGQRVVSGSSDNIARVWEAATGREVVRLTHADSVNSLAFSPDGQWVVSGSADNTVRVWEAATGREVSRMIHDGPVNSVAFSPDGQWVVSGSADGTARVWLWRDADLIALACARVGRNLTRAEWAQYFPPSEPYHKTCEQWPEGE